MKIKIIIFIIINLFYMCTYGQENNILQEFKNPNRSNSLIPFWALNGTLESKKLKEQIDLMIEKGIYGAFLHARAGIDSSKTPYFSKGWWEALDSIMVYAHKKNFELWLYDEDKWPSGSAGGRTIASNPTEFVKKGLLFTKSQLQEGDIYPINKLDNLKIFAVKMTSDKTFDPKSTIDLTYHKVDQWEVPKGTWTILTFKQVIDNRKFPNTQIDYLNKNAVKKFIDITHEEYYKRYNKLFGNTIPGIFFDEIYFNRAQPKNVLPWSNDFAESFKKRKGYDILDKLPALVMKCPNSESLNYDYYEELTYRYNQAWFKQIADWCNNHDIGLTGHTEELFETYKGEGDYIKTIGSLQFPGTDNEDFRYNFPRYIQWYKPKQLASAADIYGRNRSTVEAMGGGGYIITPEEYRYGLASLGVCGINFFIPHFFSYTIDNIKAYKDWPPSWFFRNPYWKYFKPLSDYGRRISYMNRQGSHVCHVALLYPLTEQWASGYTGKPDSRNYEAVQEILLNNQIDYDVINPDAFLKSNCSTGNIKLYNESYKVLILPSINKISYETAKKIADFYDKGGIVIATNKIPFSSIHGKDNEVNTLMYRIFGIKPKLTGRYYDVDPQTFTPYTSHINPENGGAYYTKRILNLPAIINKHIISELKIIEGKQSALRFHQRRKDDTTYYLLMNEEREKNRFQLLIPNYGIPYKLNPENGKSVKLENYLTLDNQLLIPLNFQPWEAFFLTFLPGKQQEKDIMISSTSLSNANLSVSNNKITFSGWAEPNIKQYVVSQYKNGAKFKSWLNDSLKLKVWDFKGDWKFQVVKHQLDQKWTVEVNQDTIEIPVMKFYANVDQKKWDFTSESFDDQNLPEVKIVDWFNSQTGIVRYLSPWNASRIIYYDTGHHLPEMGGQNVLFRKIFNLNQLPSEAILKITAEPSYTLFVNGTEIGSDTTLQSVESYDITSYLKLNNNKIEVEVPNQKGLIAEGTIKTDKDFIILNTDDSWEANFDGIWEPALIHSKPNIGNWQKVKFDLKKIQFPVICWYRQKLPVGAKQLILPNRRGNFEYYINGKQVKERKDKINLPETEDNHLKVLSIKATIQRKEDGLLAPIRVICKETEVPLIPWKNFGLEWYTGRAIYKKDFSLPPKFDDENIKIILDPGKVKWFAEIWVNNQLVKYSTRESYKTDITKYLKKGKNSISIVVSNLKANEAFWNVPDALVEDYFNRWWQQGATLREKEKLESGLLGPVRLIPMQYKEWEDIVK